MVSLLTVMIMAGLGATLIQLQTHLDKKHAFSIDRRRALYIAEAGLAEAALAISQGKSGIVASEEQPALYGGGLFWVESLDLPEDRIALVCTARIGSAEFVLRTLVLPNLNPVASLGFFGTQGVEIGWGTVADGYHSARGDFVSQIDFAEPVPTTGEGLLLGSNGSIILDEGLLGAPAPGEEEVPGAGEGTPQRGVPEEELAEEGAGFDWRSIVAADPGAEKQVGSTPGEIWSSPPDGGAETPPLTAPAGAPTRVYGRLRPGVDGVVLSNGFSVIDGLIQRYHEVPGLPAITLPTCPEVIAGNFVVTGELIGIGSESDTRINGDLVVGPGATLTLEGPKVLDVDHIQMGVGATIEFDDTNGPIHIYSRTGITAAAGCAWESLANETEARGVSIFVAQSTGNLKRIALPESGTFHGLLYAPSDAVVVPEALRWYGSIVARHLRTEPGARITFDRRFSIGGDGVPTLPRILSWQIVPVGDGLARLLRVEPVFALRRLGVVPLVAADATPETHCEVQYIDLNGSDATYVGAFASFNLAQATRIVAIRWNDSRDGELRMWLRPAGEDPTEATEANRNALQAQRKTLATLGGEPRVGSMTDAQVIELIATVPLDKLATEDSLVQESNERNSPQVDLTKYLDGADAVQWTILIDDVLTRTETQDADAPIAVVPGG